MIFSVPEGGSVTVDFPQEMGADSLDMLEECFSLQVKTLRRKFEKRVAAADTEYNSWFPAHQQV